jgi:hypothetical protein
MTKPSLIGGVGLGGLGVGIGAGIGAGLMYWFDPDRGKRRRSIARGKTRRQIRRLERVIEIAARDAGKRLQPERPANRPAMSRVVTGVAGGALLAYGIVKRERFPRALTLLGLGLVVSSVTNADVRDIIPSLRA